MDRGANCIQPWKTGSPLYSGQSGTFIFILRTLVLEPAMYTTRDFFLCYGRMKRVLPIDFRSVLVFPHKSWEKWKWIRNPLWTSPRKILEHFWDVRSVDKILNRRLYLLNEKSARISVANLLAFFKSRLFDFYKNSSWSLNHKWQMHYIDLTSSNIMPWHNLETKLRMYLLNI